ncbi:MAG: CehA/McbA family metallohydrolase, partial [Candidatus Binatia bacterium]
IDDGGGEIVEVAAGETRAVARSITRVVDPPDALSADFHIHSARSFDSSAPLVGRVLSFAAEGVELMVSSDHDFHVDYAPVIEAMGLGDRIASIRGNEVTTGSPPTVGNEFKFGHLNGFPVEVDPTARRRGAIEDEFVSPNWIYRRLREQGADVIQINHPRAPLQQGNTGIGWFNNAGFDPTRPLLDPANAFLVTTEVVPGSGFPHPGCGGLLDDPLERPDEGTCTSNIDFDTLEVANAARPGDFLAWRAVRRDWMSLLLQGVFKPATGVSDSHRLTVETPGYARTFVFGAGDRPDALGLAAFIDAVRAGRMTVSTGPVIRASARSGDAVAAIGDTLSAPGGEVELSVRVDAAPWIPVHEVRVLVNGVVERAEDVSLAAGTTRLDATFPFSLPADGFIVVEAGPGLPVDPRVAPPPSGTGPGSAIPFSEIVPGAIAFAFTNPIFVDAGEPGYSAPGLPDCAATPQSVVCETAVVLDADEAHAESFELLGRIRVPREALPAR